MRLQERKQDLKVGEISCIIRENEIKRGKMGSEDEWDP